MYSEHELSEENLLGNHKDFGDEDDDENCSRRRSEHRFQYRTYFWVFQLILFLVSCSILLKGSLSLRNSAQCNCEEYMPMWSPAFEAVRNTGHYQRFDGSFSTPNAFKGTPSPSIDEHWNSITYGDGGVINISEDELLAVNASAEYSVKLVPEIGGGYMASVEALHQLHCLDLLRQASYESYYKDKAEAWKDSPQTLRYHIDHCVDNLRQKLMCDADAGILTYVWVKGHPAPFPDFSVQHKCRDFDALKDWVTEHQIFTTEEHGIERLPGAHDLDSPP